MMRTGPHPDAALLFLDFILTDGRQVFVSEGALSTNRRIEEPPKGLDPTFVDNAKALDEGATLPKADERKHRKRNDPSGDYSAASARAG